MSIPFLCFSLFLSKVCSAIESNNLLVQSDYLPWSEREREPIRTVIWSAWDLPPRGTSLPLMFILYQIFSNLSRGFLNFFLFFISDPTRQWFGQGLKRARSPFPLTIILYHISVKVSRGNFYFPKKVFQREWDRPPTTDFPLDNISIANLYGKVNTFFVFVDVQSR